MSTAKKNLVLIVWFLFALSLIFSMLALTGYSFHAQVCHDIRCTVCAMVHSAGGIMAYIKAVIFALPIVILAFYIRHPDVAPVVLSLCTPVGKKTKLII